MAGGRRNGTGDATRALRAATVCFADASACAKLPDIAAQERNGNARMYPRLPTRITPAVMVHPARAEAPGASDLARLISPGVSVTYLIRAALLSRA